MEHPPHFNFKDVLRAPAVALSAKQILVMSLAILASLVVYDFVAYIAMMAQGEPLFDSIGAYGLFPFESQPIDTFLSAAIYWIGVGLAVLTLMLGFFAVSAINIEAVRGNRFLSPGQAIRFALQRLPQIFLAELSIILFVGLIVLVFALLGLVSRLPLIGEWLYVLLFAVPNFIIALFAIFVIFVLTLSVLLMPAVAAAERRGETFTAILETFSTIILQPFRWFGYTLYSLSAAKICGFIFAYFAYRGVEFLVWSASLGGGGRIVNMARSSLTHLPVRSEFVHEILNIFPWIPFGFDLRTQVGYPSGSVISYVMAFMLFLIFVAVLGYIFSVVAAGQARGYVALKFIKDKYSIAAEESLFFKDEPINDPVDQSPENQ